MTMPQIDEVTLGKIRKHAVEARSVEDDHMEVDSQELQANLDGTIDRLRAQLAQQQLDLKKLRAQVESPAPTHPSHDRRKRLQQLRILKATYEQLANEEPSLPPKESPIPALLATRLVRETVASTRSGIRSVESHLANTDTHLQTEAADLGDAKALKTALEDRLSRLRQQHQERSQKDASQIAREMLQEEQRRKLQYEDELKSLHSSFDDLVDNHLAVMLAAEELGGPIVGEMMDIDKDDLGGGFSSQGKVRKTRTSTVQTRQKRIDEIWGKGANGGGDQPDDEKSAAAADFRTLFKQLFEALLENGGSGVYVALERESAAARFLVRAKLAQYHPKDARRLRLIDFARELDD